MWFSLKSRLNHIPYGALQCGWHHRLVLSRLGCSLASPYQPEAVAIFLLNSHISCSESASASQGDSSLQKYAVVPNSSQHSWLIGDGCVDPVKEIQAKQPLLFQKGVGEPERNLELSALSLSLYPSSLHPHFLSLVSD